MLTGFVCSETLSWRGRQAAETQSSYFRPANRREKLSLLPCREALCDGMRTCHKASLDSKIKNTCCTSARAEGPSSRRSVQSISQDPFTSTGIANYLQVSVKHVKLRNWKCFTKQTGVAVKPRLTWYIWLVPGLNCGWNTRFTRGRCYPRCLLKNVGILPPLRGTRFIPNPFQVIAHYSSHHSTLYSLRWRQRSKIRHKWWW
jgi:hypothetical protein